MTLRSLLIGGSASGLAVALAAVVIAGHSATAAPAYAVIPNAGGSAVAVTLRKLSAIPAVNAQLARDGLPAEAVQVTSACLRHDQRAPSTVTIHPRQIGAGRSEILDVLRNDTGRVVFAGVSIERSPPPSSTASQSPASCPARR
jgi:hypothetical protein